MYGLPGQSLAEFEADLREAIASPIGHVSLFPMSYRPKTALFSRRDKEERRPLRAMYLRALELLSTAGFTQYTTEDFSRSGVRSDYQVDTWHFPAKGTLGLGAGALSGFAQHNWHNTGKLEQYIAMCEAGKPPVARGGRRTPRQVMHDEVLTATKSLRLDPRAFRARYGVSLSRVIGPLPQLLSAMGLLRRTADDAWELSGSGRYYASVLWTNFILGKLSGAAQSECVSIAEATGDGPSRAR